MDEPRSRPPTSRTGDPTNLPSTREPATGGAGRRSFWSRIALRRGAAKETPAPEARAAADTLFQRLAGIEERLAGVESAIGVSSERLETRLLQFWEIEEQLGQLSRQLGELEATQHDLAKRSARLSTSVTLLAVFALLAAGAALVIAFRPFPLGG